MVMERVITLPTEPTEGEIVESHTLFSFINIGQTGRISYPSVCCIAFCRTSTRERSLTTQKCDTEAFIWERRSFDQLSRSRGVQPGKYGIYIYQIT